MWSTDEAETAVAYYVVVQCGIFHLEPKSIGGVYLAGIASSFDSLHDKDAARAIRCSAASKEVIQTLEGFQRHKDKKEFQSFENKNPVLPRHGVGSQEGLNQF